MSRKVFKVSNFLGFEKESLLKKYVSTLDEDIKKLFQWVHISRKRSVILTLDDFRKGATGPTDTTIGTTPTIPALQFNATGELLSAHVVMPVDWDKENNCTLDLVFSLRAIEVNNDELSITVDYTVPKKLVTAAGVAKTSTQLTPTLDVTTANGLAVGDIYVISTTLDRNDTNNGFAFGDTALGFCIEFHLTNTDEIADIDFIAGCINYTALY